jgi:transposase-like protein
VQRWTAKRRAALVPSVLRGETTVTEAARKHALLSREGNFAWSYELSLAAFYKARFTPWVSLSAPGAE